MNKEVRSMAENIEFRDSDSGDQYIEGYALKFDTWSEDLGGFRESIHKDALKNTDTSDVRALFNHNADHIIARSAAGSLELDVDDIGLKFRAKIPNTSYGRDLLENLRNGNVNQCSFGFCLAENGDEFTYDKEERSYKRILRNIKEIVDVSVVTYPAYRDTDVTPALRSLEDAKQEVEEAEEEQQVEEQKQAAYELKKRKLKLELELMD